MVYPAEAQPRYTYLLWHIFNYPTAAGHEAAFAVTKNWGDSINSLYSVLLEVILVQAFHLLILAFVYVGNRSSSDSIHLATKVFYEDEPAAVLLRVLSRFTGGRVSQNPTSPSNRAIKRYEQTLLLVVIGVTVLFVPKIVPAFAIHGLLIGTSAPVDPLQVYVPESPWFTTGNVGLQIPLEALAQPRYLRAVGQADTASIDLQNKVTVTAPVTLQNLGKGEQILEIGYNYSLTAQDLGLQNFHGLQLNVQGSCHTEYGWLNNTESEGTSTDVYNIFGDDSINWKASPYYGYVPIAFSDFPKASGTFRINNTYAIMISSMQCDSFTIGTDPWYLTNTTGTPYNGDTVYNVLRGRPGLSCWQSDEWTYKDQSSSTWNLSSISGLNFPQSLRNVFYNLIGPPSIFSTATALGSIALASSTTAQLYTIDAASSSIYNDMQRLVLTTYISTANLLVDTTLYNKTNTYGLNSIVSSGDLDQVAQFVVSDQNITTVSLAYAIGIPIGTVLIYLIVKLLKIYVQPRAFDGVSRTPEAVVRINEAEKA
ncbi:uncharacterized protein BHQ10_000055 [Talaromyces amestolkiae]|uniref:Uncharacterized protein n=1 Tax=Talaromyces amestolkiae TaxID=1196081 RepID=A0A364KKH6_TALAM|nr:uncharacterized protein BHQ10_000055 [Talaromyces amestolkiae]RAO64043.1 hypothetical protein BHQ10_000055 [Talaromyces amestolkiae]